MSKSPEARAAQAQRIARKYRREKTAAILLPWFLSRANFLESDGDVLDVITNCVKVTDALLLHLDRTAVDAQAPAGEDNQT